MVEALFNSHAGRGFELSAQLVTSTIMVVQH